MLNFKQNKSMPEVIWNVKWVKACGQDQQCTFLESSDTERLQQGGTFAAVFQLYNNVRSPFYYHISLYYSPFFSRSFSIEIRCPEYITVTSCCQHWFPFLPEIWCWNPLQADKYLYTWLPDLIAFCKGGWIGVSLNARHSTLYSSSVMPYYAPRRALI